MLKKLLTGCLTIAAAAALALPAMAADMSGTVGGRAVVDFYSISKKPSTGDTVSYMDMASEGRLDYTLKATEGDWTVTGKIDLRSNWNDDAYTSPVVLQKYVRLENEAFALQLGTQAWGIAYLTPYIGDDTGLWDRHDYGLMLGSYRADRLIVDLKQVGLQLDLAMRHTNTDATGDSLDETEYGALFQKAFGPVAVAAQYMSRTWTANKNEDLDTKDTAADGRVYTEADLLARYAINEGMFVEADYGAVTKKDGTTGAKTFTANTMGLAFSMALSETQGFTVSYDADKENSGVSGAKDTDKTNLIGTFQQKIAGQKFWATYQSVTTKAGDADAAVNTLFTVGSRVSF